MYLAIWAVTVVAVVVGGDGIVWLTILQGMIHVRGALRAVMGTASWGSADINAAGSSLKSYQS